MADESPEELERDPAVEQVHGVLLERLTEILPPVKDGADEVYLDSTEVRGVWEHMLWSVARVVVDVAQIREFIRDDVLDVLEDLLEARDPEDADAAELAAEPNHPAVSRPRPGTAAPVAPTRPSVTLERAAPVSPGMLGGTMQGSAPVKPDGAVVESRPVAPMDAPVAPSKGRTL